jgi:hypothetical protein
MRSESARGVRARLAVLGSVCVALAACGTAGVVPAPATPAPARRVVMISIDGLRPSAYTRPDELGLAVPNLRRLAAAGAHASGVTGVLPTVTYPSHTTLITGVPPRLHGIVANTYVDPEGKTGDAWRWQASEIRAPTLVSAARAAGRSTAAVSWPVSAGLAADFLVPEIWRPGSSNGRDLDLQRALATPGIFEAAEAARGAPLRAPLDDEVRTDLAIAILRTRRPDLLLLHLLDVDSASHHEGPNAAATRAAIERADANLGRLLAALDAAGLASSTLVAVVSDHGFVEAARLARPNTLLVEDGLLELDEKGSVRAWRAWFLVHGGSAALYLADPADDDARRRARARVAAKMAEPDAAIREVIQGERLGELGGDGAAELFLDAADGWSFSRTPKGGWSGVPADRGFHGHAPGRPELASSLVLAGPGLRQRGDLGVVPITRLAGTLARYLGIELSPEAGEPLPVF